MTVFLVKKAGWKMAPLEEVATLQRGYDLPAKSRRPGEYPVFSANGIHGSHNECKVRGPGVVTGRSGTVGKVHYASQDYWPLNTALYVKDFHGNDPRWVFYMLKNFGLERFSQGAGVPTLNRNLVHGELVAVPPLEEQKRIAKILDAADALRAKRRESLDQLDALLQTTFLDLFGDPVSNPKNWPVVSLGSEVKVIGGYAFKSEDFSEEGAPIIRISNLSSDGVDISGCARIPLDKLGKGKKFMISSGDTLIAMSGATVGKIGYVPDDLDDDWYLNQRVGAFRVTKESRISRSFLRAVLASPFYQGHVQDLAGGAAQPNISGRQLEAALIPCPPSDEQRKYDDVLRVIESMKRTERHHLNDLNLLFGSLQQKAFSGEL